MTFDFELNNREKRGRKKRAIKKNPKSISDLRAMKSLNNEIDDRGDHAVGRRRFVTTRRSVLSFVRRALSVLSAEQICVCPIECSGTGMMCALVHFTKKGA